MTSTLKRRSLAVIMTLLMCFSMFASFGTTAQAAGERSEIYMISFPRGTDANREHWERDDLQFMNGWHMDAYDMFAAFCVGSYEGKIAYCIEPGVHIENGDPFTSKDETFWDNYPSAYNKTIDADTIKSLIGRILQYGYTGTVDPDWVSQNAAGADKLAHVYATQLLIWETIVGERDENFGHVSTGGKNPVMDFIKQGHPLRSRILDHYNSMVTSVQNHSKVPSFMAKSKGKAPTIELEWDGSQYTATLTDTNKVLDNYTFSSDYTGMKFTASGNTLTITTLTAPTSDVTVSASKKDSKRMGLVVWDDGTFGPNSGKQDTVTYTQPVTDPIAAYLKMKVSYGSAKIVKTSEDGKVSGITFQVTGNGIDQTVTTDSKGEVQIENLQPGEYTVTEQMSGDYVPQEPQKVTVQAGQTVTVSFNNTLQKGSLTVTKNSEDGLNSGVRFHLYGTSSVGETVDLYATTNSSGVAQFADVPTGSGYTLEEVDTAVRYVVPAAQTTKIEWEKVTNATFRNVLKKFNISLNKVDKETSAPQGDATLAGAVYGVYKDGSLVDTYTTDSDGHFTTSYYTCGSGWTVQEIAPSEGYLLDTAVYPVGADPKQYEVEFNSVPALTSPETVQKGKITIIKHCDDGSTQIETPEVGAEFAVFLKSSGSYDNAKESERDYLTCDENGFAAPLRRVYRPPDQGLGWARAHEGLRRVHQ
ncbi:SpaA isopeptide-forming pilin-related protein [Acutalibacter caecimuris]|uniref:SpaA isopeptide-forming pilin-related protein n=1 Tax=Acutalibacter caecimuris TaxID=3093657 RepID=UPI002AC9A59E|nr:SpaA isopeptide-forming pilin-related protein [Acutalibacter sp. M00118]